MEVTDEVDATDHARPVEAFGWPVAASVARSAQLELVRR
jgi:hypothetical protein